MLAIPGVANCRASPETGTFQAYARLVTWVMVKMWLVVVKAPIPVYPVPVLCTCTSAPCCFERASELRCKTIKQQPMCHGVEYAGRDALGPGSPIHHRLLHLLSIIFVLAPIMALLEGHYYGSRPTSTADSRMKMQHWSFFNPLTVTL